MSCREDISLKIDGDEFFQSLLRSDKAWAWLFAEMIGYTEVDDLAKALFESWETEDIALLIAMLANGGPNAKI